MTPSTLPDQTPAQMLQRLRLLKEYDWTPTSPTIIECINLEEVMRTIPDFASTLAQFRYYRAGFKIMVKLNTNQFYFGALMLTHWPFKKTYGLYRSNRAVLDPTIISAATQQSAEITIKYPFPQDWLATRPSLEGAGTGSAPGQDYFLTIENLAPLRSSNNAAPSSIRIQVFGCYLDPEVCMNLPSDFAPALARPQSKMTFDKKVGETKVSSTFTPAKDADMKALNPTKEPSFSDIAPTISQVPILGSIIGSIYDVIKLGTRAASSALPTISALAPLAPLLLDKPDSVDEVVRNFGTPSADQFASDVASLAVPLKYSKRNYLSMESNPAIKMGHWTLASYAAIPGLGSFNVMTNINTTVIVPLFRSPTPLGYLQTKFRNTRGSYKIHIQFFTSAFISGRFALSLRPNGAPLGDFDKYVSQIIDVKGDTSVDLTVPWVSNTMWRSTNDPPLDLHLTRITNLTNVASAVDPIIYALIWIAGGSDTQFSLAAAQDEFSFWAPPATFPIDPPLPRVDVKALQPTARELASGFAPHLAKPQSNLHTTFAKSFPPIIDGCSYVVDNARVQGDVPVSFNDLLKRYYTYTGEEIGAYIDSSPPWNSNIQIFTRPFLAIRGGYRVKGRDAEDTPFKSPILTSKRGEDYATYGLNLGVSIPGDGGWHALSIPWMCELPFVWKDSDYFDTIELTGFIAKSFAFSDDLQLGYPCLPAADFVL